MVKRKTLAIIDGKSVFYRGYYAMPNLSLPDGTPTGGVYGFAVLALEIIKKLKPDYVVVAWDKPKTNIRARLKMYPQYKANRKPAPPDFYVQIPLLHRLLEAFGWPLFEADDYEADDIMGTVALQANKKDVDTLLVTSDLDMIQLVNHHTIVAALKKGLTNIRTYDEESFEDEYHVSPQQFIDVKALKGDSSDNIPGVAGVGEKTALELIKSYDSLDGVYEHLDDIKPNLCAKLVKDKDMAYLSKKLVTIILNVPVKLDLKNADIHHVDPVAVKDILVEFEFKSLLRQLPESWHGADPVPTPKELGSVVKLDKLSSKTIQNWNKKPPTQIMLFISDTNELVISASEREAHTADAEAVVALGSVLTDENVKKIGFDLKAVSRWLLDHKIELRGIDHDVRLAGFLLNSLTRRQTLSDLMGSGNDLSPSQASKAIWELTEEQKSALKKLPDLVKLIDQVEWPLIPILARMEHLGIKIDTKQLAKMSREFADKISDIEQEMYGMAGMEFNISSPSQLAEVLYTKLQLPTQFVKKTKTGYSTAAPELDKLRGLHPIIDLVTEYREFTKLKSTYVDALPKLIDKNSKLHTTYDLDVAPTGRLSSRDPNLQNIPVRTELGKKIRLAFIPESGKVFVSADYSQFELRIAAAMAGEKNMVEAFNKGMDVHQLTAAAVYGIKPDKVTKEQRYSAKAVNFGIMYGQGPHGLSMGTGMTMKEAKDFIDKYFEIRPKLKVYIEKVRKQAHDQGFVETLFGRRRPTPDIKSSNFVVREAAMRQAVNMPLQGTAADLMKMAMIAIEQEFDREYKVQSTKYKDRPQMLLQIHDAVLVECMEKDAKKVGEILKDTMETIYPKLGVKFQTDIATGKNWGEL